MTLWVSCSAWTIKTRISHHNVIHWFIKFCFEASSLIFGLGNIWFPGGRSYKYLDRSVEQDRGKGAGKVSQDIKAQQSVPVAYSLAFKLAFLLSFSLQNEALFVFIDDWSSFERKRKKHCWVKRSGLLACLLTPLMGEQTTCRKHELCNLKLQAFSFLLFTATARKCCKKKKQDSKLQMCLIFEWKSSQKQIA